MRQFDKRYFVSVYFVALLSSVDLRPNYPGRRDFSWFSSAWDEKTRAAKRRTRLWFDLLSPAAGSFISCGEKSWKTSGTPRKSCREKSSLFEITSQESLRNQLPVETSYCRFCRIRLYCDMIEEKGNLSDVLEENTTNYMDAVPRGSLPAIAVVSTKTNRQKPLWLIVIRRNAEAEQWKNIHPHFQGDRVLSF